MFLNLYAAFLVFCGVYGYVRCDGHEILVQSLDCIIIVKRPSIGIATLISLFGRVSFSERTNTGDEGGISKKNIPSSVR